MIMPCNSKNGCGTVSPQSPQFNDVNYTTVPQISYEDMAEFMPAGPGAREAVTAQVPGTTNYPTSSGVAAAEDPWPQGSQGGTGNAGPGAGPGPVLPNAPQFSVPNNPLLPPGYQEIIDYEDLQYMNGFLRTQIGKYVRVEQLIGSSVIEDRYGYLVGVGVNYILLQEISTKNIIAIDFYNIKYVYFYFTKTDFPTNPMR